MLLLNPHSGSIAGTAAASIDDAGIDAFLKNLAKSLKLGSFPLFVVVRDRSRIKSSNGSNPSLDAAGGGQGAALRGAAVFQSRAAHL